MMEVTNDMCRVASTRATALVSPLITRLSPLHRAACLTMIPLPSRNVLGGPLKPCSLAPRTGFFRNGHCDTCAEDTGCHTVCVEVTDRFLEQSRLMGNDLSTPQPDYDFPGLKP